MVKKEVKYWTWERHFAADGLGSPMRVSYDSSTDSAYINGRAIGGALIKSKDICKLIITLENLRETIAESEAVKK